jgi:transposase
MKKTVRAYPDQELHVILDNSSTHGTPDLKAWLTSNPQVPFDYTPTSASWLNQVEDFFGILGIQALLTTDFKPKTALRDHFKAYLRSWNQNPTPFEWTKPARAIIRSHRRMLDHISPAGTSLEQATSRDRDKDVSPLRSSKLGHCGSDPLPALLITPIGNQASALSPHALTKISIFE